MKVGNLPDSHYRRIRTKKMIPWEELLLIPLYHIAISRVDTILTVKSQPPAHVTPNGEGSRQEQEQPINNKAPAYLTVTKSPRFTTCEHIDDVQVRSFGCYVLSR
jgi:hypothetical protein